MNDYSLSPVFNTRGIKELTSNTVFKALDISENINYTEDFYLEESESDNNPENVKGVFKISNLSTSETGIFNKSSSIKPMGIKFNFTGNVINGIYKIQYGLKDLTKGFFIVRQKRIPTILAQAVGIGTASKSFTPVIKATSSIASLNNDFFIQSFLKKKGENNLLEDSIKILSDVRQNALLCPEATIRSDIYSTFFNSSSYKVSEYMYQAENIHSTSPFYSNDAISFYSKNLQKINTSSLSSFEASLLLLTPGIDVISSGGVKFSSKAGLAEVAHTFKDAKYGDYTDEYFTDRSE
jgi:hypothetical protein